MNEGIYTKRREKRTRVQIKAMLITASILGLWTGPCVSPSTLAQQLPKEYPIYEGPVQVLSIEIQPPQAGGLARAESAPSAGALPQKSVWRFGSASTMGGAAEARIKFRLRAPMPPKEYKGEEITRVVLRIEGKQKTSSLTFAGVMGEAFASRNDELELTTTINGLISVYKDYHYGLDSLSFSLPTDMGIGFFLSWIRDTTISLASLLDSSLKGAEEVDSSWDFPLDFVDLESLLLDEEVEINLQRTYHASSVGIATSYYGGYIIIEKINILGYTTRGEKLPLTFCHKYIMEGTTTEQVVTKETYDNGEHLVVRHLRTHPFKKRGKIYTLFDDAYWRLEAIELDDDPSTRMEITGDSFEYPVYMDKGHELTFYFQRAVADLTVGGFMTDPPINTLQQGQDFTLYVLVRNVGELTSLEASRSVPLSGEFDLLINVDGKELLLNETWIEAFGDLQGGDARTLWAGTWVAPFASSMTIQVTVDAGDYVDEGIKGEENNTMVQSIPLSLTLPDLAFRDLYKDAGFSQVSPTILRLYASVTNLSSFPVTRVVIRFEVRAAGQDWGRTIGDVVIPHLPANSSERVELNWNISKEVPGYYTVLVIIDPENEIQESNETNNLALIDITLPIPPHLHLL